MVIDFSGFTESIEKEYKKHWNKIHYGINLLKEDDSEYIVWFDHDIIIKNFDIKLEDIIKEYGFDEGELNLYALKRGRRLSRTKNPTRYF